MNIKDHLDGICVNTDEVLPIAELRRKVEERLKSGNPLTIKYGVDPTAPDLHLGHAVTLRKLRSLQDLGHLVILLIGDFTARIGDPTERKTTRPQLSQKEIEDNAATYLSQAFKILDPDKTEVRNNSSWFSGLGFDEILKITAKMTVARILERDDFAKRLKEGTPIGLHELMYPMMQGYDSVELANDVEIGGTDQKFNMHAGRDLQREYRQEPQVIVTMPILEGTDGVQKMSKSLGNHIGLTESPEDMFAKVMSIPDESPGSPRFSLISKYFRLATDYTTNRVAEIEKGLLSEKLHPVEQKRLLAREIVILYHGTDAAEHAEEAFDKKHKKDTVFTIDGVVVSDLDAKKSVAKPLGVPSSELNDGRIWIVKLVSLAGFASSNSDARRLIDGGAVRLNGATIASTDEHVEVRHDDLLEVGKRNLAKLVIQD